MSTVETQAQAQERPAPTRSIPIGYDKQLMVTAGRTSMELGGKIADKLGVDLTDAGLKTFANGEVYCKYQDSIRGADLFIIQSTCTNEAEGLTANDALMELMCMIDAAVGASAHRVIAVTPWYGYSRQDKKSAPREPITARLVARMLEAAGIDRLLTMDLHAGQVQGFFQKPVDHMTALPFLSQYVGDQLGDPSDLCIISPDAGRVKLTRKFAQMVGAPYALLEKERPAQQVAEIGYVIGADKVKGRKAVIVDDMIDTGGTLAAGAQTVLDAGASEVYAVATHGLFSGNAFETLTNSPLAGILVTDTVPLRVGAPADFIRVLSCADILSDSVRRIFTDDSVSEIFAGENQLF
jgi:ribose-phosphate pyrophosphokinase